MDSLRELELKQIREEERCLEILVSQREKIVEFKKEAELKHHSFEQLLGETEKLKTENEELKTIIKCSVEEYETSLQKIQNIMIKEREEKDREIQMKTKEYKHTLKGLNNYIKELEGNHRTKDSKITAWKNHERSLKCKISELSFEKLHLENTIEGLLTAQPPPPDPVDLTSDLNRALALVSRQEQTISSLRLRKQEDDSTIKSLKQRHSLEPAKP